jgi:hypothetical protein
MPALMIELASTGPPFYMEGRGWVHPIKNPGGYPEPAVLLGQDVLIDGEQHHVVGVESFAVARPHPDRLDFALLVRRG